MSSAGIEALLALKGEALMVRQEELEQSGMAEGVHRFRRKLDQAQSQGRASQVGATRKLLQTAIDPMAVALKELIEANKGRRGRKHYVERWIHLLGADELAYLTAKVVLDAVTQHTTLRERAMILTEAMSDEMRYRKFRETAPSLFNYRMENFHTSNTTHMKRSLSATMNYADVDTSEFDMTVQVRLVVGIKLVDMFQSATGCVELKTVTGGSGRRSSIKSETLVVPTPDTLKWLSQRNAGLETLWPVFMPMVVPPLQWQPGQSGGYRFALRAKHRMVRGITKEHAETVRSSEMPVVYNALNAIQETAWRINPHVFKLVRDIADMGGGFGGVPQLTDDGLPARPQDIATNEVSRKAWRKAAHAVKERNHQRKLRAIDFHRTLATATSVKDEAAIYFPCNLDFRGRVYPVTNFLNPQGDDLSKGLLTFAEGKPLGNEGAVWLALHGANCLGETQEGVKLSKATLQERVDVIVALSPTIERIAADPLQHHEWCAANVDDPLQFFAFCVEWAGYLVLRREGRGHEYVCSLPCAMDGTCNGLQHFAAMLCDPIGGEAVNVQPSERPQDIYQRISDTILKRLESEAVDNPMARLWLSSGLVNRKLAKRPTMTFGYGSKKFGFQQQMIEYVRLHERWDELKPLFSEPDKKPAGLLPPACGYMSGLIWDALQETVVAASQAMKWMQDAARYVVSKGKCVAWSVPVTNFPVKQTYMQSTVRRIETVLQGRMYQPRIYDPTDQPNIIKQANAVAPNVIHSLDAAALMLTVNACREQGVTSFGMVHDSYGTLAADCEVLAKETREQFVRLYTEVDVVDHFAGQLFLCIGDMMDEDLPVPPAKGTLDVNCVRESLYFFS